MVDETMFERRLAVALGQYADLAPTMDDELVARTAVRAGGRPRFGWLGQFAETFLSPGPAGQGMRVAYVLVLLALLLAADPGRRSSAGSSEVESPIVVGPQRHDRLHDRAEQPPTVTSVAIDPDGQGIRSDRSWPLSDVLAGRQGAWPG
jgi:hypothetical protein